MDFKLYEREWKLPEVISAGIAICINQMEKILLLACIFFLPISIIQGFLQQKMMEIMEAALNLNMQTDISQVQAIGKTLIQTQFIDLAITLILAPVGVIAVALLVRGVLQKEEIQVKAIAAKSMEYLGNVLVTGVLFTVLVILFSLPFMLLLGNSSIAISILGIVMIIIGLFAYVVYYFYIFSIGLSEKKAIGALRYGESLVRGRWGKTILYFVAISFVAMAINWIPAMLIAAIFQDSLVGVMIASFISYCCMTISISAFTVLFLNREGIVFGPPKVEIFDETL